VRRAKNRKTGARVAIKFIKKERLTDGDVELLRDELRINKRLDHPNIVRFVEALEDKKYLYIVFELMHGGELLD